MPATLSLSATSRALVARALRLAGPLSAALLVLVALVWRRGDWPAQRFLIVYIAPVFWYAAEWVRERLGRAPPHAAGVIAVDVAAFVAGALRTAGGWGVLPYSGHMLFLAYAALTPTTRALRLAALLLVAMTSVFKLLLWHDARSWSLGLLAGALLAGVRAGVRRSAGASWGMRLSSLLVVLVVLVLAGAAPAPLAAQSAQSPAREATLPSVTLPRELDRVLRDYERLWRAGDAAALSRLFAEDGFVLQSGRPPVRGRAAIATAYAGQGGGELRLRALAYATADTVGYIVGAYGYGADDDVGKFTLTLRRTRGGPWLIFSDMDNASRRPSRP